MGPFVFFAFTFTLPISASIFPALLSACCAQVLAGQRGSV
ncbi:hypothetical protein GWL_21870 [Herbaspirillum sp. GW103]|nr:hypothetical protein GWL_21870 [Herbaspirillum sp. GW103]